MASGGRGRAGRPRGRGGRPTIDGQKVSWDFNDKTIDTLDAQETFFPDIELPETYPPTAAELRMVENYQLLRKRYHNDLRQIGWPIDPVSTETESDDSPKSKSNPFKAFPLYSQSKYQKKARGASSVVRIQWDPKRHCLQHFPASLRNVIKPAPKANTSSGDGSTRPNKKKRVIEDDDDDEDDDAKKGEDEGQEGRDLEEEDVEEPDPDETFSQDDEDMAGDYGDNYFENGEDDDDYGGGADEGGGGDDYE